MPSEVNVSLLTTIDPELPSADDKIANTWTSSQYYYVDVSNSEHSCSNRAYANPPLPLNAANSKGKRMPSAVNVLLLTSIEPELPSAEKKHTQRYMLIANFAVHGHMTVRAFLYKTRVGPLVMFMNVLYLTRH